MVPTMHQRDVPTKQSRLKRIALIMTIVVGVSAVAVQAPTTSAATPTLLARGLATSTLSPHEQHQLTNINVERVDPWCWKVRGVCWASPKSASKTAIVFGDSHAAMWLPALAATLSAYKIGVWWRPSCSVASLKGWNPWVHKFDQECSTWRSKTIASINAAHPTLVVMAERTSSSFIADGQLVSEAGLTSALRTTFAQLRPSRARLVMIGDISAFAADPVACLSLHLHDAQQCTNDLKSLPSAQRSLGSAERNAARNAGVTFVDPRPWVCSSTRCPAILGSEVGYSDSDHLTASAVAAMAKLFAVAIGPALR